MELEEVEEFVRERVPAAVREELEDKKTKEDDEDDEAPSYGVAASLAASVGR